VKAQFTMFREEGKGTEPGPASMRRVLAFMLAAAAVALFAAAFFFAKEKDWYAYLPGIACLCGSLLLLFFTTWSDMAEFAKTLREKK